MSHGAPLACFHCHASHRSADNRRRLASGCAAMNARINKMSSAVTTLPRYLHSAGILRSVCQNRNRNASLFYELTLRHTGAASVSGLPATRSNCAWCARSVFAGVAPVGHHLKRPFDNRFVASQNPCESYANIRIDFPLRLRKINRQPEKGSASSFSRQS